MRSNAEDKNLFLNEEGGKATPSQKNSLPSSPEPREQEYQQPTNWIDFGGKTLWDWLGVALIPLMLFIGTIVLSLKQDSATQSRHNTDLAIAEQNREEATLSSYGNTILGFVIDKNLTTSSDKDTVRMATTEVTRNILTRLDTQHKRSLVLFLFDLGLLSRGPDYIHDSNHEVPVASLSWDDLSGIDFRGIPLKGADLRHTVLRNAKATPEQLSQVWSLTSATMPDGTKCSPAHKIKPNGLEDDQERLQVRDACVNKYMQTYYL